MRLNASVYQMLHQFRCNCAVRPASSCISRPLPASRRAVTVQAVAQPTGRKMSKPTLHYFPLRGRGEVIRLALSAAGVDFDEKLVDYAAMKSDLKSYPFGQCPAFDDGDLRLVQSNTILRYLARKLNMNGHSEQETCTIDMIMEGVESIRGKYLVLIYQEELKTKDTYWAAHGDKASLQGRNYGAHLAYLAAFVAANPSGYAVGSSLTMADLCIWDIVDLHARIYPEQMAATYPELMAHHRKLAEVKGIKQYLVSERRFAKVNNNNLG